MKILITGGSGLVGSRFKELSIYKNEIIAPSHGEMDITDRQGVRKTIIDCHPDWIVHFAAYTNVSVAEQQRGDRMSVCYRVNVDGTRNILEALPSRARLIYISTDMVFSGSSGPYSEIDVPEKNSEKITWYGYTKKLAEDWCQDQTTLRITYPVRAEYTAKLDYLRKPLVKYDNRAPLTYFDNQQVSITLIDEACMALNKLIEYRLRGVFHASSSDLGTPYEIISYLIEKSRGKTGVVQQGKLPENSVRYPRLGGLKVEETEKTLGIKFSPWREIIDKLVEQGI